MVMRLDEAYENGAHIAGGDQFPPRWQREAAAFRASLGFRVEKAVPYGDSPRQVFDFFQPEGVARGTVVFVHGGYWKAFDNSYWSHLAAGPLTRGWAVAMPSYDLCPDVSITQIGKQIAQALKVIAARTQGPIALTGHSAGGHLVTRVMDPLLLPGELRARIGHIVSISPVADLVPLLETSMNAVFSMDLEEATRESPVNMGPPHGVKVNVWVGADERPAFLEQAEGLAKAWGAKKVIDEGKHHFDVIDALADGDSDMVAALLGLK